MWLDRCGKPPSGRSHPPSARAAGSEVPAPCRSTPHPGGIGAPARALAGRHRTRRHVDEQHGGLRRGHRDGKRVRPEEGLVGSGGRNRGPALVNGKADPALFGSQPRVGAGDPGMVAVAHPHPADPTCAGSRATPCESMPWRSAATSTRPVLRTCSGWTPCRSRTAAGACRHSAYLTSLRPLRDAGTETPMPVPGG